MDADSTRLDSTPSLVRRVRLVKLEAENALVQLENEMNARAAQNSSRRRATQSCQSEWTCRVVSSRVELLVWNTRECIRTNAVVYNGVTIVHRLHATRRYNRPIRVPCSQAPCVTRRERNGGGSAQTRQMNKLENKNT